MPDYKHYEQKAEEAKQAANELRERVAAEKREFAPEERDSYERMRAEVEVNQRVANDLREAEIENLRSLVPGEKQDADQADASKFFREMAKDGREYDLRALVAGSGSGSYLVPEEWNNSVAEYRFESNFLRANGAQIVRTSTTHNIPVLTANGVAAISNENAAYTAVDPTIGEVTLGAYKLTQKVPVTEELLADSAYDVASIMARSVGLGFGAAEEKYFLVGSGSSEPTGILNKTADKTLAGTTAITKDELIEIVYGLARQYRPGAVWMMNDATALAIAKLKLDVTTSGTTPYFWTDAVGGEPPMLLGHKVFTNSNIETMAATKKVIAFGNPSEYVIGERGSFVSKRLVLNEYSDTFAFHHRIDGKPLNPAAFHVVAMHA